MTDNSYSKWLTDSIVSIGIAEGCGGSNLCKFRHEKGSPALAQMLVLVLESEFLLHGFLESFPCQLGADFPEP